MLIVGGGKWSLGGRFFRRGVVLDDRAMEEDDRLSRFMIIEDGLSPFPFPSDVAEGAAWLCC
jgi:hypothetical protein